MTVWLPFVHFDQCRVGDWSGWTFVIDHFVLFGAAGSALTLTRAIGLALMSLGVWLTQQS